MLPRASRKMFYTAPRPPNLKNLGLPWKAEELRRLEDLVGAGLSAPYIARIMERSTVAIRAKTAALRLRLPRGRHVPDQFVPSAERDASGGQQSP